MDIEIIPCLSDNYAYLVPDGEGGCAVVDPSEMGPVEVALGKSGLKLKAVLCTHHHWDHVGGVEALVAAFPGIAVYGHVSDKGRIPQQTVMLEEGDTLTVGKLSASVLHIPGHTTGAVAYVFGGKDPAVFTGDTLFAAGCGRLFEGTPAMMNESLNAKLAKLDAATRVYCGHEYTEANLRFAQAVEPGNGEVAARRDKVREVRAKGLPSVPSTMGEELATNPFMRTGSSEIRKSMGLDEGASDAEVLGAVRAAKDRFKG